MVQSAALVVFGVKPLKLGEGWYVVASHPSGQQEHITGFHTEAEANEWLADSQGLRAWFKTRGYTP